MKNDVAVRVADNNLPSISWNSEEVRNNVTQIVEKYKGLVYTEDNITWAKQDKADLNKVKKDLEDVRKAIKKKCLMPYEEFEREIKDIVGIIDTQTKQIECAIDEYEQNRLAERKELIAEIWESKQKPSWLLLEQVEEKEWLNKSTSKKKIEEAIDNALADIEMEIESIKMLAQEEQTVAIYYYKHDLDIKGAMQRVKEFRERNAQAQIESAENKPTESERGFELIDIPEDDEIPFLDDEELFNEYTEVTFNIRGTESDLIELRLWLLNHNIDFTEGE